MNETPKPDTAVSAPVAPTPTTDTTPSSPAVSPAAPVTETVSVPNEVPNAATNVVEPAKVDAITNVMGDAGDAAPKEVKAETKPEAKPEVKPEAKPEVKPEAKPEVKAETGTDTKSTETKTETPPETKVELPTYEIKFPDGLQVDKEPVDAFNKLFGEIETGKLDHKGFNEKAQKLVDMHVEAVNKSIERLNDYYVQIHEGQKKEWFEAFKKDADIGGDHVGTTVQNVREAISQFGGKPEQITELREQMKQSGYGNYVPLLRLINNMQAKINSYTKEKTGGIVPGSAPAPVKTKDYQRFYGGK